MDTTTTTTEIIYCANHPTVETLLRCNKCDKPICMRCAVKTPVGYRCKECVYSQQKIYFTAGNLDNLIVFAISMVAAAVATPIAGSLLRFAGFFGFIFAFMLGSGAGGILVQLIRWAISRRRSRYMGWVAVGGIALGFVIGNLALLYFYGFNLGLAGLVLLPTYSPQGLIFAILAGVSTYQFLR